MIIKTKLMEPMVTPLLEASRFIFLTLSRYFNWSILFFKPFKGRWSLLIAINSFDILLSFSNLMLFHSILVSLSLNGFTKLVFTIKSSPRVETEDGMIKYLEVTLHLSGTLREPEPIGNFTVVVASGQISVISIAKEHAYIQPIFVFLIIGLIKAGPKCLEHILSLSTPLYKDKPQLIMSVL